MITELNDQDLEGRTPPQEVLQVIRSIIGYFNLDPNRVLDIILESFECQLDQHDFFVSLLRDYTPDQQALNELLGFKYKFYVSEVSTNFFKNSCGAGLSNDDDNSSIVRAVEFNWPQFYTLEFMESTSSVCD